KIYIFSDCDRMDVRAQNILLKIIEEPPAFAYFIFTADSRQALLPTVISRLVPFGISPCTEEEAVNALTAQGCSFEDADEAVKCFHGNIGQCIAYLEDENVRKLTALTKEAVRCIIDKREYDLLKVLYNAGNDRNSALSVLNKLECVFRDASALRLNSSLPCTGCDPEGALRLSERISAALGQLYHKCIGKAYAAISANVNVQLVLTALCAELMGGK
ncbi:MAG: DNA polymerase III subunit delta', partial [Oscillospiraceae bacterium]|nr:DNA polymerase III subunit delta' [Oscillospiraceae bacterium]